MSKVSKSSKFFGITPFSQGGEPGWKAQLVLAGALRYLGFYSSEEEAARVAENALEHLAEFRDKPPGGTWTPSFPSEPPLPVVVNLRKRLEAERDRNPCASASVASAHPVYRFRMENHHRETFELVLSVTSEERALTLRNALMDVFNN